MIVRGRYVIENLCLTAFKTEGCPLKSIQETWFLPEEVVPRLCNQRLETRVIVYLAELQWRKMSLRYQSSMTMTEDEIVEKLATSVVPFRFASDQCRFAALSVDCAYHVVMGAFFTTLSHIPVTPTPVFRASSIILVAGLCGVMGCLVAWSRFCRNPIVGLLE